MNQDGYIVEIIDEDTAMMRMMRMSACAKCGKCMSASSESEEILVEVDNTIGAKVGDHVVVSMEHINVMKATFLVYVIPMVLLIVGIVGSYYALNAIGFNGATEVVAAVIGIALMGLSYIYLKINDKSLKRVENTFLLSQKYYSIYRLIKNATNLLGY